MPLAISLSTGEVILIVVLVAIPISLATFVLGAGNAFRQIGKGQFAVEFESDVSQGLSDESASVSSELRQLLEAKAYRQKARGEAPVDVEAELARLLAERSASSGGADPHLAEEV